MAPKLYHMDVSPGVRAVLLCAKAIGLELELIETDLFTKRDHKQPKFLKINPQHTIPVLDDDGFIVVDSHAIMIYLVQKYGKGSSLYPTDLQKSSTINQKLYFDAGILFPRGLTITKLVLIEGEKKIPEKYLKDLEEAFKIAETYLERNTWVAGDTLSIADFSLAVTITSWAYYVPITQEKFSKISGWLKKLESLPYFNEVNKKGMKAYHDLVAKALNS